MTLEAMAKAMKANRNAYSTAEALVSFQKNLTNRSIIVSFPRGVSRVPVRAFGLTPGSVAMIRLKLSPAPYVSRSWSGRVGNNSAIFKASSSEASQAPLQATPGQPGVFHKLQSDLVQPYHGFALLLVEEERHNLTDGLLDPGIKEDVPHSVILYIHEISVDFELSSSCLSLLHF
jgi:hypothetical protein